MGEQETVYDAVVVGTGFGGSATALRLAEAGQRVCVLERGRRFGPDDFPDMPAHGELLPDTARLMWGADQGMWDVQDLDQVLSIQVAGYGGGSLGYASVHLVPPPEVFDEGGWPLSRDELLPYYALARHMLSLETIDAVADVVRLPITKTARFMAGASAIGRADASFHPPLAIRLTASDDACAEPGTTTPNPISGRPQATCVHCGGCVSGCRHRAKNTLDANYLAKFETYPDTTVFTLAEVIELHPPREGATGSPNDPWRVVYRDHHAGQLRRTVRARRVFLCAGSVNTTKLLFRNETRLSRLSDRLGSGYFPNADALGVVYDTERRQNPGYGPTITSAVVASVPREDPPGEVDGVPLNFDWDTPDDPDARPPRRTDWVMLQDGGYDPSLQPILSMLRAPLLMARNRHDDVGKFRDVRPGPEYDADRRRRAAEDAASPEANYPRQPARTYEDRFRDPLLGALAGLIRSGDFMDYLPEYLGRVLPAQLDERFRERLELPGLQRVSTDTQSIALWRHLLQKSLYAEEDAEGRLALNALGRRMYGFHRGLLERVGRLYGLDPVELAKAAMMRSRHELGTDHLANFALGWLGYLVNHNDASTAPFDRRAWSHDAPHTFTTQRSDHPGEFVHMLLAMGRDASSWDLRWQPPLAQAERRRRAEELDELARSERWDARTLRDWADRAAVAEGISHEPEGDTPNATEEERERLEDQGSLEARPPVSAQTTHTRGTAHAMPVYAAEERLMRDMARQLGGELRLNPRWVFAGQAVTVHSQGGCGMGDDDDGVCDAVGRVRGYEGGLYVQDGALFPGPVGVNPSHTILALVERNLERIRVEDLGQTEAEARAEHWAAAQDAAASDPVDREPWTPPRPAPAAPQSRSIGVRFQERLTGSFLATPPLPRPPHDRARRMANGRLSPWFKDRYQHGDTEGRHLGHLLELSMRVEIADLATFVETGEHQGRIDGEVRLRWPELLGDDAVHEGTCAGGIRVLPEADQSRPGLESMRYALHLRVGDHRLELAGQKVIVDDPGADLWADTTALFVRVRGLGEGHPLPEVQGILRLGLSDFVGRMVRGLEVTGTEDPARIGWAIARFLFFFGGGLQRAYAPQVRRFLERLVRNELGIR